jgi:hypothetical protein
MDWIANFLGSVPHLVWGSLITFSGVVYADSRNSRRVERQNQFSAEQSTKERLMAVRKEVYLDVPDAFLSMQTQLFDLIKSDDAEVLSGEATDVTVLMAKVTLVSSSETAILAERLAVDYGVTHSRLLHEAQSVRDLQNEVKRYGKAKKIAVKEYERIIAELKREQESGQANESRVAALKISLAHVEKLMVEKESSQIESANEATIKSHEFLVKARDACLPLIESAIQLTIALRWELGQATDHEQYRLEMNRGRETFLRTSEESLAKLKKHIEGARK